MRTPQKNLTITFSQQIQWFCLAAALESALAFLVMLFIPGDPKNAWLLGFSRARVSMVLLFLVLTVISGAAFVWLRNSTRAATWQKNITAKISRPVPVVLLTLSALLGMGVMIGGIIPIFRRLLGEDLVTRLLPLLVWGLLFCIQTLVLMIPVWKDILKNHKKSASDAVHFNLDDFLILIIYTGVLLLLIGLVVQLAFFVLSPSLVERFISPKGFTTLYIKFNLNNENNIPNYYSTFILLVLAVQFFWIARGCKQQKIAWGSRWSALGWVALFFSMNEIANLQAYLTTPVRNVLHTEGIWRNAWYLPSLPVLFLLLLWCIPLFRELSSVQKIKTAFAFLFGILGMFAMLLLSEAAFLQAKEPNVGSELFHVAEKAMEYLGMWLMIAVANEKMLQYMPKASFEVTASKKIMDQNVSGSTMRIFYKRLPWVLVAFVIFFVLVNLTLDFFQFIPALKSAQSFFPVTAQRTLEDIFNLEVESAPPTYFSSILLIMVSILLGIIAAQRDFKVEPGWGILSAIFLFLSMDEAASLHELLFDVVTASGQPSGIFHYAWYIPVIPALIVFGLLYFRFWLRLPVFERIFFVVSAGIYLYGVIGMEAVSGWFDEMWGVNSLLYNVAMTVEETMEMTGMILFIYTLLHYIANWKPEFQIQLHGSVIEHA